MYSINKTEHVATYKVKLDYVIASEVKLYYGCLQASMWLKTYQS